MNNHHRWHVATYLVIGGWIAAVGFLMVADVWDETNGMLAFSTGETPLTGKLAFVLTQPLGFWRPIPALVDAAILHVVTDFDVSWRVLRAINIALLLGTLALFWKTLELVGVQRFVLTVAFLCSGSGVIVAGWYANVFDAAALAFIAVGLFRLVRGHERSAGVLFGLACFCKESAALVLPFLLVLVAAGHISTDKVRRAALPAAALGGLYFALRSLLIAFGGPGDIHGFHAAELPPTMLWLAESFWEQNLKAPGVIGLIALTASLAVLRRPRVIGAVLLFLMATAVVYSGMLVEHQSGVIVHHLNFVGRLYLIPTGLFLFLLALERRALVIACLSPVIVFGGVVTYLDHLRFQNTYRQIYRTAERASAPLVVDFARKPLDDPVRGIRIGDFPDAPFAIDPRSGLLVGTDLPDGEP
jgi:hypothetical protein